MSYRPVALLGLAAVVACDTVPVEEGARRTDALARLCINSVAASLKIDRGTVAATGSRSMPEGDEVSVITPDGSLKCYVGLDGKVFAIRRVATAQPET